MQTIREIRKSTGLSQTEFGRRLGGIPLRTIQNWENSVSACPAYVTDLIAYRVQHDPAFKTEEKHALRSENQKR